MRTELFTKDANGKIRIWCIEPNKNGFCVSHGTYQGEMQYKYEEILKGKAGRTQEEQISLEVKSRINKQRDKGYVDNISQLKDGVTNSIGLFKPMLAKTYGAIDVDFKNCFIQPKLDGNRCIITNIDGNLIAYSRNGKLINTIDHILHGLELDIGESIDGELYCHGVPLQTIVSWIKRKQADNLKIKFHAYDMISQQSFPYRLERIAELSTETVIQVPTFPVYCHSHAMEYFEEFRTSGYEGAMLRHSMRGYEDGKRSNSLLKMKEWQDAEFWVESISESKDGWAILNCKTENGKRFSVTCHGDHEYKTSVFKNKEMYIGKVVTVKYAYLTDGGVPFHPVAINWR